MLLAGGAADSCHACGTNFIFESNGQPNRVMTRSPKFIMLATSCEEFRHMVESKMLEVKDKENELVLVVVLKWHGFESRAYYTKEKLSFSCQEAAVHIE